MSDFTDLLDDLDAQMLDDFHEYHSTLMDHWENFQGNKGQSVIVKHHIIDKVATHIEHAKHKWPYNVGPDDYYKEISKAYDPDVMARAFGQTIEKSYADAYKVWLDAMDAQHEHDDMTPGLEPHSTSAVWD